MASNYLNNVVPISQTRSDASNTGNHIRVKSTKKNQRKQNDLDMYSMNGDEQITPQNKKENLMTVAEILAASKRKAATRKAVPLPKLSGKANEPMESTQETSPVYHITSERYLITKIGPAVYVTSRLDVRNYNQPYLLTKGGPAQAIQTKSNDGINSKMTYMPNHISSAEFESIIANRPSWKQITSAYCLVPILDDTERFSIVKALEADPTIVW